MVNKAFENRRWELLEAPKTWLVTGVAGFIGSNLLEWLLENGQTVVGVDNFASGLAENLVNVRESVGATLWEKFLFVEGDVRDLQTCRDLVRGVDYVLHQAAIGGPEEGVGRALEAQSTNITGFLNMVVASRDEGVSGFVYASSTRGKCAQILDQGSTALAKPQNALALSKLTNELYAEMYAKEGGIRPIGLRYGEVFGPRHSSAKILRSRLAEWIHSLIAGERITLRGDGLACSDFCHVDDIVQANILAAVADPALGGAVYEVGSGESVSQNELFDLLALELSAFGQPCGGSPVYQYEAHEDDAPSIDITRIRRDLGYQPRHSLRSGIASALPWYLISGSFQQVVGITTGSGLPGQARYI